MKTIEEEIIEAEESFKQQARALGFPEPYIENMIEVSRANVRDYIKEKVRACIEEKAKGEE